MPNPKGKICIAHLSCHIGKIWWLLLSSHMAPKYGFLTIPTPNAGVKVIFPWILDKIHCPNTIKFPSTVEILGVTIIFTPLRVLSACKFICFCEI